MKEHFVSIPPLSYIVVFSTSGFERENVGAKVGSCGIVVTIAGIVGAKVGYLEGNGVVGNGVVLLIEGDGVVLLIEGDNDELTDGDMVGDFDGGLLGNFVGVLVAGDDVVVEGEYDGLTVGDDVMSLHGGIHSLPIP
mmetsp:Transcript_28577/g.32068  ORF Transcript_28577/g.32068 Transcript_28577/m.32068 type:complete len:137 (-) Transcript_28577:154-564(-)